MRVAADSLVNAHVQRTKHYRKNSSPRELLRSPSNSGKGGFLNIYRKREYQTRELAVSRVMRNLPAS